VQELLHEIDQEATLEQRTAWTTLKRKIQAMLRLADVACKNIAADPQNHILRPPAAADEQEYEREHDRNFHDPDFQTSE